MPTVLPFPPPAFLTGGRWFDETGVALVAANAQRQALVSVRVPPSRVAVVMGVGIDAGQLTNWYWGRFELELNGSADPSFNNIQGMIARILEPIPVYRIAQTQSDIVVRVSNLNTTVPFQYAGRVVGYFVNPDVLGGRPRADLRAG